MSVMPFIPIGHLTLLPNTLNEIDESTFLSMEEPSISILPLLQKVGDRLPDMLITTLWNNGDYTMTLKKNTTIGFVREAEYTEKNL